MTKLANQSYFLGLPPPEGQILETHYTSILPNLWVTGLITTRSMKLALVLTYAVFGINFIFKFSSDPLD
jgi:hypothetical protein